ncbi:MAG: bifunctional diaminohydroxyphosphoribosylaminopyrimidine deaminase/5-amino-6-(5-phosphoribosylamino)uracil reductase RibD, partial [Betaproteobacteria bacterium]|nr:bifunctional diaminohydroxyphosphoribosylaminopyrimidine deaminase/5-amino-6-(5-phosphoribosylamino)uracil reductase RibD [Betaproteobacteria bacterium]
MARALALAERGLYGTSPNPRVGCVVVRDGAVAGEGWHAAAGLPHAEINALAQAGSRARGATLYLTLEPCSHHGRTPPCADALVAAGVARVVAAMQDPNPEVAGSGFARLRAAGIEVASGLMGEEARELNIGFVSRMRRGRPWVRMKIAATLDGRTALANGASQWITGEAARRDGHHWRARACAVLTGAGTVKEDDPQLTVRLVETARQPLRVVVDSRLEIDPGARIFEGGNVLVVAARADEAKSEALRAKGAEVVVIPNPAGKTDLPRVLAELARRGVGELHVEAGARLNGSLLREGCVDELLIYLAPALIGDTGRGMFSLPEIAELSQMPRLAIREVTRIGEDMR